MKRSRFIGTAIMLFFLGSVASVYSKQDHQPPPQDKTKHEKGPQREKTPPAKAPPQQQPQHQPRQQGSGQPDNQRQRPPAHRNQEQQAQRNQQQQQQNARNQQEQQRQQQQLAQRQQQGNRPSSQQQHMQAEQHRDSWQRDRARSWQTDHRDWQQRGGYNGYRIPNDRFRISFGSNHGFRIYSLPVVIYSGRFRFQFNGYWFSIVDPWPEYWSDDWYENDDVYIDYYNNGYYMQNRRYPGTRLAISISLR